MFSIRKFPGWNEAGGSLCHYPLYTFQHRSKVKIKICQGMAKIIDNGEIWVAKLDLGADESI